MYVPASFRLDDPRAIDSILERFPFATVVANGPDGLEATPVPLLLDADTRELVGHVARKNPIAKILASGAEALCIFSGPHAYVSPRWYTDPVNVPTWNYVAVHVAGPASTFEREDDLVVWLGRLVERFEHGAHAPWRFDLPPDFVSGLAKAIVGFRVPMRRVDAKIKLSQNRDPADARGALEGLEASADAASREVAAWMRAVSAG